MAARTRRKARVSENFLTDDVLIWLAGGVLGYPLVVLLLALESMAVAEFALQFQLLCQLTTIALVLLGTIGLFAKTLVSGWNYRYFLPLVALLLLLPGVKPSEGCCGNLIAFVAGSPEAVVPVLSQVVWHVLPMLGCGILIVTDFRSRRRFSKTTKKR